MSEHGDTALVENSLALSEGTDSFRGSSYPRRFIPAKLLSYMTGMTKVTQVRLIGAFVVDDALTCDTFSIPFLRIITIPTFYKETGW
jgi:hypothetical protein